MNLDINEQHALFSAFGQLDGYDTADGKRVPFKLGSARRSLVKNNAALRASLSQFEDARKALFREIWPDKGEGDVVTPADDPAGFERFKTELATIIAAKDDIALAPLPGDIVYSDVNDIPASALETLEKYGLLKEPA